jgi:hypothetical protein
MALIDRIGSKGPKRMLAIDGGRIRGVLALAVLQRIESIPSALMFAALNEQDLPSRVFGDCLAGDLLDREWLANARFRSSRRGEKLFTYVRYNAELMREGRDAIGCTKIKPEVVQKLDAVDGILDLFAVGTAIADLKVQASHFSRFPPVAQT